MKDRAKRSGRGWAKKDRSSAGNFAPKPRRVESAAVPAQGRLVMGRNCLKELLKYRPDALKQALVARYEGKNKPGEDYGALLKALHENEVPVRFVGGEELSALLGSSSHQSFGAVLNPGGPLSWKEYLAELSGEEPCLVVLLDGVCDPQNVGAIVRAAECFGAGAIVWSHNRGPACHTPVISKSSAGASELAKCFEVANLAEALRRLKKQGFWVVGAEASAEAIKLNEFEFPPRCALVMGSEGQGLGALVQNLSDYLVSIPLCGKISSLNVSQAASIMLYAYRGQFSAA